jgi:hypothetical protein
MTEQPKTRLFAITIHAWRPDGANSEVNVQTFIALLTEAADVQQVGTTQAFAVYPSEEGWKDQQAISAEVPPDSQVGPFRLRWNAEVIENTTTAGAES